MHSLVSNKYDPKHKYAQLFLGCSEQFHYSVEDMTGQEISFSDQKGQFLFFSTFGKTTTKRQENKRTKVLPKYTNKSAVLSQHRQNQRLFELLYLIDLLKVFFFFSSFCNYMDIEKKV